MAGVVLRAFTHAMRTAIVADGVSSSYNDVLGRAAMISDRLTSLVRAERSGHGPRVAIMTSPGRDYVESTWGAWIAGCVAVPLCLSHPARELSYVLSDSQASAVVASPECAPTIGPLAEQAGAALHVLGNDTRRAADSQMEVELDRGALIIYTSGTTGRPKGALHTHSSLGAQAGALMQAWELVAEDRILHALPLHHVHGAVAALHAPQCAGAAVEFMPRFSAGSVWERLMGPGDPITVFMGVPTMYSYLLAAYDEMAPERQAAARAAAARLRLAVSGQVLLERYGMTETGMILSNPLHGERRPGAVGLPLPGVKVRCVPEPGPDGVADQGPDARPTTGELRVKGLAMFSKYWGRPDATAQAFDADGWFRTGDTVVQDGDPPYWRILGRTSADILKSGGFKISALDVENAILAHPAIREAAVVGLPDEALGQRLAAVVACSGTPVEEGDLQAWLRERLPAYQVPKALRMVDAIPRNAMGKVNKKELVATMFS